MAETENIPQINSYDDFVAQLNSVKESASSVIISFYKYCYLYAEDNAFEDYKEMICFQLKEHGLEPYKVTDDMNLIFRYKSVCEAVMYIKPFAVDYCILRL